MTETAPVYTYRHWAKSDRADPERIHLLEHHLADVGDCFEVLLELPTILSRLTATTGLESLHDATKARLCVLAALHDIGKVNVGFQTQIWRNNHLNGRRRPIRAGHTSDVVPVLGDSDSETADWFFDTLGWDEMLSWDDTNGLTACGMLAATLSHHGEPLNIHESISANPAVWRSFGELDPITCVSRIGNRFWTRGCPALTGIDHDVKLDDKRLDGLLRTRGDRPARPRRYTRALCTTRHEKNGPSPRFLRCLEWNGDTII